MGRIHTEELAKNPTSSNTDKDHNQEEEQWACLNQFIRCGAQREEYGYHKNGDLGKFTTPMQRRAYKDKKVAMEICVWGRVGEGDDFSHPQWTMTREEEKVFL